MNKENILWKQKKIIDSVTSFSLLDYNGVPSAILWFSGCNMRCDFCYNQELVLNKGKYCFNDTLSFLESRKKLLKGIVLCGGEPTNCKELYCICKELKNMGYKVKLDTNGLNYNLIKILINENLIDFVALDFKALQNRFEQITKVKAHKFNNFVKTIKLLISSKIDYEIRTTYHEKLLSLEDIHKMLEFLKFYNYKKNYYIQNFINKKETLGGIRDVNKTDISKLIEQKYPFKVMFRNF